MNASSDFRSGCYDKSPLATRLGPKRDYALCFAIHNISALPMENGVFFVSPNFLGKYPGGFQKCCSSSAKRKECTSSIKLKRRVWCLSLQFDESSPTVGPLQDRRFDARTASRTLKVTRKIAELVREQRRTVESASNPELVEDAADTEINLSLLFESDRERGSDPARVLEAFRMLSKQRSRLARLNGSQPASVDSTIPKFDQRTEVPAAQHGPTVDARGYLLLQRSLPVEYESPMGFQKKRGLSTRPLEWTPQPFLRSLDIWDFAAQFWLTTQLAKWRWTYGIVGSREELEAKRKERRRAIAAWVREELIRLGPTFIKAGQLFSARSDLFPAEVVDELSKLQDSVPPFPAEVAKKIILTELGIKSGNIGEIFSYFEDEPIAAASLGQVHLARLRSTGEYVVVKVQRRQLRELFDIDLRLLKSLADFAQRSSQLGGPTRDWPGIFEECKNVLLREIDYIEEGRSADRFRENFRNIEWVRVPKVFWEYTTQRVLVQQYLPGIKISNVAEFQAMGYNLPRIAKRVAEAYLFQILGSGFFHADPHPGNLAVAPGEVLIYYDFGMMGTLSSNIKERIVMLLAAVVDKDADTVMKLLIELGALVPPRDPTPVRRTIQFFLNSLGSRPVRSQTVQAIGEDLYSLAYDRPFRLPATFTFVLRAFTTLEGLCKALDPGFAFGQIAQPYGFALLRRRSQAQSLRRWLNDKTIRNIVSLPNRLEQLENSMQRIQNGDIVVRSRNTELERLLRRQSAAMETNRTTIIAAALAVGAATVDTNIALPYLGDINVSLILGALAALFAVNATRSYISRVRQEERWDRFLSGDSGSDNNAPQ